MKTLKQLTQDSVARHRADAAPQVIAIANQKGGVGKTTTAVNLATGLVAAGCRVLIIDMDPQGNASTGLGLEANDRPVTSYHLLLDQAPLGKAAHSTAIPRLDIVPATVDLLGAELELIDTDDRARRLRGVLREARAYDADFGYDYVLIDCPPSLGLLTLNALVAATSVLVPLQCEFYALEGLSHLLRTIERIRQNFNPDLEIHGVVLTMYDRRNKLSSQVESDVRGYMGDKVFKTVIPRNVRVSEAPSHGKPAMLYDYRCAGSEAYIRLAHEMLRRGAAAQAA